MSGYNISADDRFISKGLPKLSRRKKKASTVPQDAISTSRGMVIKRKRGLPESKYVCVRKQYTKEDAAEELWDLQKHQGRKNRWVTEHCDQCDSYHILRLDW